MLTIDLLDLTLDLDVVKEFINTSPRFDNWLKHIRGVFLIVSREDASRISAVVRRYTHEARLLVVEVSLPQSDGRPFEKGWKWIRRRSEQTADARTLN